MIRSTRVGSRNHILKIASAHPGSATNGTGPNRTSTSQIGLELKFGSAFLYFKTILARARAGLSFRRQPHPASARSGGATIMRE
jgi:hypothetical protein